MDGYCVDSAIQHLRCLKAYESMYPCLLHESSGSFGGEFGYIPQHPPAITWQQCPVRGRLAVQDRADRLHPADAGGPAFAGRQYGVIVSASLAQIATAAEVLRSILWPVAMILLVLDLLFGMLFSRWFTRPMRSFPAVPKRLPGNYDVQLHGCTP